MRRLLTAAAALAAALPSPAEPPAGPAAGRHIVFVIGEGEYRSEQTLPALAKELEEKHGWRCTLCIDRKVAGDATIAEPGRRLSDIPGLDALETADLAVFFLRYRTVPEDQARRIRAYLESGRPVVGFRTSTHAFRYAKGDPLEALNAFGAETLGAPRLFHYGHASSTNVSVIPAAADHPILRGVDPSFHVRSWLYHVRPDHPPPDATPLLLGRAVDSERPDPEENPVAWTWKTKAEGRVFTTTMGHPEDFAVPAFRRLVVNGILWALEPEAPSIAELLRRYGAADDVAKTGILARLRARDADVAAYLSGKSLADFEKGKSPDTGNALLLSRSPAVADWLAGMISSPLGAVSGKGEVQRHCIPALVLIWLDDRRGVDYLLTAYRDRDPAAHRNGLTALEWLHGSPVGDWKALVPELISHMHPAVPDDAPFIDMLLGGGHLEPFLRDGKPDYENRFGEIRQAFETWWTDNGDTYDPVLCALLSEEREFGVVPGLRFHRKSEQGATKFLWARFEFFATKSGTSMNAKLLRNFRAWYTENRAYLAIDGLSRKWVLDEAAKAAGVPAAEFRARRSNP